MKCRDAISSNEFQWFDFKIGYTRGIYCGSPSNDHQGSTPHCLIILIEHDLRFFIENKIKQYRNRGFFKRYEGHQHSNTITLIIISPN